MPTAPATSWPRPPASLALHLIVILIFGVDAPNLGLSATIVDNRLDGAVCRQHGVILVVVSVHTVPSHGIEIRILIQVLAHLAELPIVAKIGRICLRYANQSSVDNVFAIYQSQFL